MLQPPCGMGKLRYGPRVMGDPPKVPLALRVSTTRQGVAVTNCTGGGPGVIPNTAPRSLTPPLTLVPWRLPELSKTNPEWGFCASEPLPKLYTSISRQHLLFALLLGDSSKTVPPE